MIEEYVTDRGRRRQRTAIVDLDEIRSQFRAPGDADLADWQAIRSELRRVVGDQTFEIWLDQLGLAALDQAGALVLATPSETRAWVAKRFGRLLERIARSAGRSIRTADDRELQLLDAITPDVDRSLLSAAPPQPATPRPAGGRMTIATPTHQHACKDRATDRRVDVQTDAGRAGGKTSTRAPARLL